MAKILVSIMLFSLPLFVGAATVVVEIDTGTETVNALEGVLVLPAGMSVQNIYTGNSAILIWITPPRQVGSEIIFAGITPGGFRGKYPVLVLKGDFGAEDLTRITFDQVTALRGDGSGTSVPVRLTVVQSELAEDSAPPELFTLVVSSSPDIFDGRRFVSFIAQDKGTGVDHYEYASSWFFKPRDDTWITVDSPLLLSRGDLFKKIFIRAVDHTGNYRVISTAGPYHYAVLFISTIILICVLLLSRRSFH